MSLGACAGVSPFWLLLSSDVFPYSNHVFESVVWYLLSIRDVEDDSLLFLCSCPIVHFIRIALGRNTGNLNNGAALTLVLPTR